MHQRKWQPVWALMVLALFPLSMVEAAVDPNARTVLVRSSCTGIDDCFTSLGAALDWTWNTRVPTATTRLLIDLEAGDYYDTYTCADNGFVTLRGAGRDATVIKGAPVGGNATGAGADIRDCEKLEFADMTFENADWPVIWHGAGSSSWTNVDIRGLEGGTFSLGWVDDICPGQTNKAEHYFFGSRISATGTHSSLGYPATAYWSQCSEAWFFGGEITWNVSESGGGGAAVVVDANGDFRAFGTAIRAHTTDPAVGASQPSKAGSTLHASCASTAPTWSTWTMSSSCDPTTTAGWRCSSWTGRRWSRAEPVRGNCGK